MASHQIPFSTLVGRVLAEQRAAQEFTQLEFAGSMGITKSTWSRLERGESPLEVGHLAYACARLGIKEVDVIAEAKRRIPAYNQQGYEVVYLRPRNEQLGLGKVLAGAAGVAGAVLAIRAMTDDED